MCCTLTDFKIDVHRGTKQGHFVPSVLKFSFALYLPDTKASLVMTMRIPEMFRPSKKHRKIWGVTS